MKRLPPAYVMRRLSDRKTSVSEYSSIILKVIRKAIVSEAKAGNYTATVVWELEEDSLDYCWDVHARVNRVLDKFGYGLIFRHSYGEMTFEVNWS